MSKNNFGRFFKEKTMRSTVEKVVKDLFTDLQGMKLNDGQTALLKSMRKYYARNKKLSIKQIKVLLELREYAG